MGDRQFKTFLCVLTAVAGQHSYIPVSHPGKFPRGLAAPMTTALCTGWRHTIFILIHGLGKAIRNSREGGNENLQLSGVGPIGAGPAFCVSEPGEMKAAV